MCGQFVCYKGMCQRPRDVYDEETKSVHRVESQGATTHSKLCGNGTVALLLINSTLTTVIRGPRSCMWGECFDPEIDDILICSQSKSMLWYATQNIVVNRTQYLISSQRHVELWIVWSPNRFSPFEIWKSDSIHFQTLIWTDFDKLKQQIHIILGKNNTVKSPPCIVKACYFGIG